jgi:NADH-quinone oxidoreductase subunit N
VNGVVETFTSPDIKYALVAPLLIVLTGGVLSVLVEAFVSRPHRRMVQLWLVAVVLLAAFVVVVRLAGTNELAAEGTIAVDGPGLFMMGSILLIAMVSALLIAERMIDPAGDAFAPSAAALPGSEDERVFTERGWLQTEVWPLFLFSTGGMMMFATANDLLTMFVALEVMSLPLYLLAGMARRRRLLSQEAAMKYFLLGAYSSGFFVFGAAMLYGFSGTISFNGIVESMAANPGGNGLLIAGACLLFVGLLFKIGAVPFHQWTPDVYQGAPTPATAFMAAGVKIAAVGGLLRLCYVALGRSAVGLAAGHVGGGHRDHAHRSDRGADPDRHQAHARLLGDRERRLHADRRHRHQRRGPVRDDVLPAGVRLLHSRRLRDREPGARPGR